MPVSARTIGAPLLVLAGAITAMAGAHGQGDGSHTNNLDLLRGSFSPFCEPAMLCHQTQQDQPAVPGLATPVVLVGPEPTPQVQPVPQVLAAPQPLAVAAPAPVLAHGPVPVSDPAWRASYALTISGSLIHADGETRHEAGMTPSAAWTYTGGGRAVSLRGSAQVVQPMEGPTRVAAAALDGSVVQALGPNSALSLSTNLALSQDDPLGLSVTPDDVMRAPLRFDGSLDASYSQTLGLFDITASLGMRRSETGETALNGGTIIDNSAQNRTGFSGGMRLGYALTPIVGVFVSGTAGRDEFDRISPDLGVSQSGWTYDLRGGITANWHEATTLEASLGSGWRHFDAAGLPESQSLLYGLAIGYSPDPTLRLRAALDTAIEPGTAGAASSVDHTLSLEVAYKVNQWLGLRASGSASWSEGVETASLTRRYGAGLGADIVLGQRTSLALDYGYGWRSDPAADQPERAEHRLGAGFTLQY